MIFLFADTEGNSLHERRLVELAFQLWDSEKDLIDDMFCTLIKPDKWIMFPQAQAIHGISISDCYNHGVPLPDVVPALLKAWNQADVVMFHNSSYDMSCINGEMNRLGILLPNTPVKCSMKLTRDICRKPNKNGRGIKNPSLNELHRHCYDKDVENAHSGSADVVALRNSIRFLIQSGQLPITALKTLL